ncbi:MAG TPA: DinB family protein [Terriglobales bacterium]|nr:DinB family protein [Terriglobales bacterium]
MATTTHLANTECRRIADQLRRAFEGDAWHGPAIRELVSGMTAEHATVRPIQSAHSAWELLLHIEAWEVVAINAIMGVPMPVLSPEQDFPVIGDKSGEAWRSLQNSVFSTNEDLVRSIENFGDARLTDIVPGRKYDFYQLLHGMTQHGLYHAGQIALLKKLVEAAA